MDIRSKNPFYKIFGVFGEELRKGTLNVMSGPPGIGKTTMLVHLGIYRVMCGYHILHISKATPDKVSNYYNSVLSEVLKELSPKELEAHRELIAQKRTIISFTEEGFSSKDLIRTISNLRAISIEPCCLLMDGVDLVALSAEDFIDFLKGADYEVWASTLSEGLSQHTIAIGLEVKLLQRGDWVLAKVTSRGEGDMEKKEGEFVLVCNSLIPK